MFKKVINFAKMKSVYAWVLAIVLGVFSPNVVNAQLSKNQLAGQLNTITTMVPFLTISPDSRSAALGDAGVAMINPDANSVHWNMANLAFAKNKTGFSMSYAPWMRNLVDDVFFAYLSGYSKIGDNSAVGGSFRYFSLGTINFTDFEGQPQGNFNPNEFAFDGAYSTKFTDKFSMGVNLRFIYSNIAGIRVINGISTKPGVSGAGDISLLYKTSVKVKDQEDNLQFGLNIQNVGSKMTYSNKDKRDFLPTNLKLGAGWSHKIDDFNKINFLFDVNKLLVPTPPVYNDSGKIIAGTDNKGVSPIAGILKSFGDAPGGFKEEINEFNLSFGAEYWYTEKFAGRLGVFNEAKTKGNRKYATIGFGLRYQKLGIDAAILVPFARYHPLANQLRFSLLFDISSLKDDKN